jgi:hypothetical protein
MTISLTVKLSRLFDGERDSAGDCRRWYPHLFRPLDNLAFTAGFVMESARFVWTNPGETPVTRSLSPASCRKASVIVRTAFLVAAYTAMVGVI